MKVRIPIEQIRVGDIDLKTGKRVVNVTDRRSAQYIRAILEGGWPIIDGYYGATVEIQRACERG